MKRIKKFFSILIGKVTLFLCKLIGRGSSTPGVIAYKFNKNILNDFILPKNIIVVTGSSGKGSTTKMINDVYKDLGFKVAYNSKGSNQLGAIITTLIENCNMKGYINTDVCVFELDERSCKYVIPYIKPTSIVITNITRDQPPRQRHFDFIYNEIEKSLLKGCNLIINGDDPYLQKFQIEDKYNCLYYGLSKNKYSYNDEKFNSLNIYRCPKCLKKLDYNYYNFETLGDYKCPSCDFKRPKINYEVTDINYDKSEIKINNKYKVNINNNMLFNIYNTISAFACLAFNKLDCNRIAKSMSKIALNKKLFNEYKYKNRNVYVLNNKAENASTYNQSVFYTSQNKNTKTLVLGWMEISRRYNFDDLSWLYDIDFELLNDGSVDKIICCGPQKYDIALRMKYAGFDENKIKVFYDLYDAEEEIKDSNGDIYAILNFDYVKPFNDIMEEDI